MLRAARGVDEEQYGGRRTVVRLVVRECGRAGRMGAVAAWRRCLGGEL